MNAEGNAVDVAAGAAAESNTDAHTDVAPAAEGAQAVAMDEGVHTDMHTDTPTAAEIARYRMLESNFMQARMEFLVHEIACDAVGRPPEYVEYPGAFALLPSVFFGCLGRARCCWPWHGIVSYC